MPTGDHVILHSHWHGLSDNLHEEAVVDIFRLEGGKVLAHWDVMQPITETSANANTMFRAGRDSEPLAWRSNAAKGELTGALNECDRAALRTRVDFLTGRPA